jgi:phenylpyruvate tautomerase PptA (4-oxalocrotonate tautomerase family)
MPLVRIDIPEGKSETWIRAVADGVHAALVATGTVPDADRFQTITERKPGRLIADPHFQGFARGPDFSLVQIFWSQGRSNDIKRGLYAAIARNLAADPGLRGDDVMIALVESTRVDWSFGGGIAQYVPSG